MSDLDPTTEPREIWNARETPTTPAPAPALAPASRHSVESAVAAAPWWAAVLGAGLCAFPRTRILGAGVITASLAGSLPAMRTGKVGASRSGTAWRVRVVTANVLNTNQRPQEAARMLERLDADVLVLVERCAQIAERINLTSYPHRMQYASFDDAGRSYDLRVFSRLPFSENGSVTASSRQYPVLAVELPAGDPGTFQIVPVHTLAPHRTSDVSEWRAQLDGLGVSLAEVPTPLVVCGDFNASLTHLSMRRMLRSAKLSSVLARHGKALRPTWGPRGLLAVLPIDHVLVSGQVRSDGISVRRIPGSDHRALVADLRL